jgi:hypothetical protein
MQSLLFCQDENSARVLIPLVQGLDIVVKHETEVFSAMRSLMAERFDFLIIDYEDEQTGRILLQNARRSATNQAALTVAVVDPELGANSLRLGADFIVTRPLKLRQAGGVLRRVRSSILRSRRVSSAEIATKVTAAEPMPLPQETAPSPQKPGPAVNSPEVKPISAAGGAVEPEPANPIRSAVLKNAPPEQSKMRAREVPKGVVTEIEKTPPQLSLVWMATIGVILLTMTAIAWHIYTENSSANRGAPVQSSVANSPAQSNANATESTPVEVQIAPELQMEEPPTPPPAALAIVPGSRASTGMTPHRHSVTLSKPGYPPGARMRTIKVATGFPLSGRADLAPLTATVSLNGDPANAAVWMDGRDTGRVTPAQISVDKPGDHTFIFKKQGYLDETTTVNLRIGQTFDFAPSLHALGRTDEIKMVGKFRTILGGREKPGMGVVSIKTQPKGAQIAVNTRIINKPTPAMFYLNPGDYVVDITLSGFKIIHRVVSVDKGGKIVIDEVMDHE